MALTLTLNQTRAQTLIRTHCICDAERTDGLLGMGTVVPILLLKYATWSYSCWKISFARACTGNADEIGNVRDPVLNGNKTHHIRLHMQGLQPQSYVPYPSNSTSGSSEGHEPQVALTRCVAAAKLKPLLTSDSVGREKAAHLHDRAEVRLAGVDGLAARAPAVPGEPPTLHAAQVKA